MTSLTGKSWQMNVIKCGENNNKLATNFYLINNQINPNFHFSVFFWQMRCISSDCFKKIFSWLSLDLFTGFP